MHGLPENLLLFCPGSHHRRHGSREGSSSTVRDLALSSTLHSFFVSDLLCLILPAEETVLPDSCSFCVVLGSGRPGHPSGLMQSMCALSPDTLLTKDLDIAPSPSLQPSAHLGIRTEDRGRVVGRIFPCLLFWTPLMMVKMARYGAERAN